MPSGPRDLVTPLVAGAGLGVLLHVARGVAGRLSEGRRTVRGVTGVVGDAALFELSELVPEPEAVAPATGWAAALGVFDLETTGVDTATARIVTAHVGLIDEHGGVVERHEWIVDPGVPIPEAATAVHGVSTARARRFGRPSAEVVPEIVGALRGLLARGFPLVVYNAPYDLTLLAAEAARAGVVPLSPAAPIIDPLVIDRALDRYRKGKRTLSAAAAHYGVELTDAHEAGADAIAAGRVAQAIARRYGPQLAVTAQQLHDAQIGWCGEQAERFQAYMREQRDPAFTTTGAWPAR